MKLELTAAHQRLAEVLDALDFLSLMLTSNAGDWRDARWAADLILERDNLLAVIEHFYGEQRA